MPLFETQARNRVEAPSKSKAVPVALAVAAAIALVAAFFSIMSGVAGAVLVIASFICLVVYFGHRPSRKYLSISLVLSVLCVVVAAVGLLMQLSDVQAHCSWIFPQGSPAHVACFQENYSPWRGAAQALFQ